VILRRKRLPEDLEAPARAFDELIPPLERAKAALTGSVPGTRLPGRPLAETLSEFEEDLGTVRDLMDGWRAPEVEQAWLDASAGLDESLELARRIRIEAASPQGFEGLIGLIGDLLAPLGAFDEAAETFRALRR
jgi:hypothetical protein